MTAWKQLRGIPEDGGNAYTGVHAKHSKTNMDVGSSLNVLFSFDPKLGHFVAKVSFIPISQPKHMLDNQFWRTHFNVF